MINAQNGTIWLSLREKLLTRMRSTGDPDVQSTLVIFLKNIIGKKMDNFRRGMEMVRDVMCLIIQYLK